MKRILSSLMVLFITVCGYAQKFEKSTTTNTLKEQTMIFKYEHDQDHSVSLILWGESTGMGAILEIVDMVKSPNPKELECGYEIVDNWTLYLTVRGNRFQLVKFHNDVAYLYSVEEEKLTLKIPRTL